MNCFKFFKIDKLESFCLPLILRLPKRKTVLFKKSFKANSSVTRRVNKAARLYDIQSRVASIFAIRGRMYRAKIIQVKLFWAKGTANRYQSDYVFIVITAYIDFQTKLCVIPLYIICSIILSLWYDIIYNYCFTRLYFSFNNHESNRLIIFNMFVFMFISIIVVKIYI